MLEPEIEGSPFPGYWLSLQGWLSERGLWFLEMQLPPNMPWMPLPFAAFCILFGDTRSGIKHAIIGKLENADFIPVWNPWPEAEFAGEVAALGFILPQNPANYMNLGVNMAKVERLSSPFAADDGSLGRAGVMLASIHATAQHALGTGKMVINIPNGNRS